MFGSSHANKKPIERRTSFVKMWLKSGKRGLKTFNFKSKSIEKMKSVDFSIYFKHFECTYFDHIFDGFWLFSIKIEWFNIIQTYFNPIYGNDVKSDNKFGSKNYIKRQIDHNLSSRLIQPLKLSRVSNSLWGLQI